MRLLIICLLISNVQMVFAQFNTSSYQKKYNSVPIRDEVPISVKLQPDTVFVKELLTDTVYIEKDLPFQEGIETIGKVFSPLTNLTITSRYGMRFHPIKKKWLFHSGVDFSASQDTVKSVLDGTVLNSGYDTGLGYFIKVEHDNYVITYAHLSQYFFLAGAQIKGGQPLGITGSTGLSTAEHLHFSVHYHGSPIDPLLFLKNLLRIRNNLAFNTYGKQEYQTIGN